MVAKRGILFELDTALGPNADRGLSALEKRIDAIEKRASSIQVGIKFSPEAERRFNGEATARQRSQPSGGANGAAGQNGDLARREAAEKASQRRRENLRRDYDERERQRAERTASIVEKANQESLAQQIKDLRKAESERQKASSANEREAKRAADAEKREIDRIQRDRERSLREQGQAEKRFWDEAIQEAQRGRRERDRAEAQGQRDQQRLIRESEREDAQGWKRLSAMGGDAYRTGQKVSAGFEALSAMGRAAMPRDPFAEGLKRLEGERKKRTGWEGLGARAQETQDRLNNLRRISAEDDEKRKRALDAQKGQLREINAAAYDVVHSFGQMTRAAAQFGLVGQRDMMRVLDTIFAVEGGINAIQGGMGAFKAIHAIREARAAGLAAKTAGGMGMTGTMGAAASKTLGTMFGGAGAAVGGGGAVAVAAPVSLIAAAAASVAAAIGSAALTIREASQFGFGRGGRAGAFVDRVGGAFGGLATRGANLGLSAISPFIDATAPYGLTSRERELRSERVQQGFANTAFGGALLGAGGSFAILGRQAERMQRFTEEEISNRNRMRDLREEIDAMQEPLFARGREARYGLATERFQLRSGNMQRRESLARNRISQAFGREETAHSERLAMQQRAALGEFVDPRAAARAAADLSREEGLVTGGERRLRNNLLTQHAAATQREQEVERERFSAQNSFDLADTQAKRDVASEEIARASAKLKQIGQERLQIEQRIREVGIEGAQRQLQLNERNLANARQTADILRGQRQSVTERFGRMLPWQQRAAIAAARDLSQGGQLNRFQLETLEQFPELFGPQLREQFTKRAKQAGIDQFFGLAPDFNQRTTQAEQQERQIGKVVVEGRQEVVLQVENNNDQTARDLVDLLIPILQRRDEQIMEEVKKAVEHGGWMMQRRQNIQGRQAAGG